MTADAPQLTIDELARQAGLTVRNVRNYQSRGLLPAPEVRGRTGFYGAEHLARLQLIREMQAEGFNLAAIGHLVNGATGAGEEVLAFTRALTAPFETENPEIVEAAELLDRLGGDVDPKLVRKAEKLGLVVPLGEGRYEIPSPTLLDAGERAAQLGIPFEATLEVSQQLGRHAEGMAQAFVKLFVDRIWKPFIEAGQPEADWPRVRGALEQLRPLASETVTAAFQQTMTRAVEDAFGRELARGRR